MSRISVTRRFTFSAAHHLTDYYGDCERPHGHTYRLEVTVSGPVRKNGLVIDFTVLKDFVSKKIISKLDHRDLNEIFKNPSAELIVIWIWRELRFLGRETKTGVKLVEIKLWEGDNNYVSYAGD